jgi:hypothetical protein
LWPTPTCKASKTLATKQLLFFPERRNSLAYFRVSASGKRLRARVFSPTRI